MDEFLYSDILDYVYPNSEIEEDFPDEIIRAAQFAPFAALTGHDAAIAETARLTDEKTELDDYAKEELNRKLLFLKESADDEIFVTVEYFVADKKKAGGKYVTKSGLVTRVREFEKDIAFDDGTQVPIENIAAIEFAKSDIAEE